MNQVEDQMNLSAAYIARNLKEITTNFSVQISQVGDDRFNFGVLQKDEARTLFEASELIYLSEMTLKDIVDLKNALSNLIKIIECSNDD